jgi:hypothetical protein
MTRKNKIPVAKTPFLIVLVLLNTNFIKTNVLTKNGCWSKNGAFSDHTYHHAKILIFSACRLFLCFLKKLNLNCGINDQSILKVNYLALFYRFRS